MKHQKVGRGDSLTLAKAFKKKENEGGKMDFQKLLLF